MLALDTNVLVRYLTADHPTQSTRARKLIDDNDVLVSTTVLLETEWVLRGVYGLRRAEIIVALRGFAGLARVTLQDPDTAARALDWAEGGLDFADALHLASAATCEAFVSFDRAFARAANRSGGVQVRAP